MMAAITNQKRPPTSTVGATDQSAFIQKSMSAPTIPAYRRPRAVVSWLESASRTRAKAGDQSERTERESDGDERRHHDGQESLTGIGRVGQVDQRLAFDGERVEVTDCGRGRNRCRGGERRQSRSG